MVVVYADAVEPGQFSAGRVLLSEELREVERRGAVVSFSNEFSVCQLCVRTIQLA